MGRFSQTIDKKKSKSQIQSNKTTENNGMTAEIFLSLRRFH